MVCDERIIAAAEEARFLRIKHWGGSPSEAIAACLVDAGTALAEVDPIAINSLPGAHRLRKLASALARQLPDAFPGQPIRLPFERATVVSVDGFCDFASKAWGLGDGTELAIDAQIWFPLSLDAVCTAITQYLGFPHFSDEYMVMWLVP